MYKITEPNYLLLSTHRSGSSFLRRSIRELVRPFDDHNFAGINSTYKGIGGTYKSDFWLIRNHLGYYNVREGFWEYLKYLCNIVSNVIVHSRDIRSIVLSEMVRPSSKTRISVADVRNFDLNIDEFRKILKRSKERYVEWNNFIHEYVHNEKLMFTSFEELKSNPHETIESIAEFIGKKLSIQRDVDEWDETPYHLLKNVNEVYNIEIEW